MSKRKYIVGHLNVEQSLFDFVEKEVCEGLDISAEDFYHTLSVILSYLHY